MKLPLTSNINQNGKTLAKFTNFFTVGETRSVRIRCAKCFSMFTRHTKFVDRLDGTGAFIVTSRPHCD